MSFYHNFRAHLIPAAALLALLAPTVGHANTPGQYCKTVSGCEVLDIETSSGPGYGSSFYRPSITSSSFYGGSGNNSLAITKKYCFGGNFKTAMAIIVDGDSRFGQIKLQSLEQSTTDTAETKLADVNAWLENCSSAP